MIKSESFISLFLIFNSSLFSFPFKIGMLNAFRYGAPPHGGFAPGIDRIVMLIANEPNIREVILFPMNQRAEDLMMNAPNEVSPNQLKELHVRNAVSPKPAS